MLISQIVEKIVNNLDERLVIAMRAGCEIVTEWDKECGIIRIKTKYPIALEKGIDNQVIVYEDKGGIKPEIKAIMKFYNKLEH